MSPIPSLPRLSRRAALSAAAGAASAGALARPAVAAPVNGIVIGRDGWLFAQSDAMTVVDPTRVRRVLATLKETISLFRAAKIETVVMLTPSRARLYRDMLPADVKIAPTTDARAGQARGELGAMNVLVPDLYPAFQRQRQASPNTPLYFKADTHWMSYGAELAAGEVAKAIRERFRLPNAPGPGAQLGTPTLGTHVTDLAAQLPVGDRDRFPPQTFPARPETSAGGSLLDEERTDTAVVGNSYMHPRYGFSRALSYALERPVALHWQVHGTGPYRTMLNYLGGDSFKGNKPSLLIWDFTEMDMEVGSDRGDVWGRNAMNAADFLSQFRSLVGA